MTIGAQVRQVLIVAGTSFRGLDRLSQWFVHQAFGLAKDRLGPITLLLLAAFIVISIVFWEWLQTDHAGVESGSTTIRNLSFVVAGLIALPLAIWRSFVSQRQADAAHQQADTAQRELLNERYKQGAEMLGHDVLAVRIGGIFALERLAREHPEQYYIQIMRLFCAFVRHPTTDSSSATAASQSTSSPWLRDDVQAVVLAITTLHTKNLQLERDAGLTPNLRDADLSAANLHGADFSHFFLPKANLKRTHLHEANLSHACLASANLTGVLLHDANVSGTDFAWPGGEFPAKGLTQEQLDKACADPSNPPNLVGVVDAETGNPLVWRGRPLED